MVCIGANKLGRLLGNHEMKPWDHYKLSWIINHKNLCQRLKKWIQHTKGVFGVAVKVRLFQ